MQSRKSAGRVRWGIIGTGSISRLVASQAGQSEVAELYAVASRSPDSAQEFASAFGIPQAYSAIEDLLRDSAVDAVYVALPHALHAKCTLAALDAGKHVLCEKPLALDAAEVRTLMDHPRRYDRIVCEGFMLRQQPQWRWIEQQVTAGALGAVRALHGFSALKMPAGSQNHARRLPGDGSVLLEFGCYSIHLARMIFRADPVRVLAMMDLDRAAEIDTLVNAVLEFPTGVAHLTVASSLQSTRRIHILGTEGNIEVFNPVQPPPQGPVRVIAKLEGDGAPGPTEVTFPAVDQYRLQIDEMSHCIQQGGEPTVTLENSYGNMKVVDALRASASRNGQWVVL